MTKEEYAAVIKQAALTAGKSAVVRFIVSKIPFFGLKIVNPILGLVVGWILEIAIRETEFGLFFQYIDMRTGNQANAFEAAAIRNYMAQKTGTASEKKNAESELIKKFNDFVRLTT